MATESSFYLDQVENCERKAEASTLPNQRDMHLRSKAAWQALADRRLLTETNRAELARKQRAASEVLDG